MAGIGEVESYSLRVNSSTPEDFKLSTINFQLSTCGYIPWDGHIAGCADDWLRLRRLSLARPAWSTAAFFDLHRNAGVFVGGGYWNGFQNTGVARKYPQCGCGDFHTLAHRSHHGFWRFEAFFARAWFDASVCVSRNDARSGTRFWVRVQHKQSGTVLS